MADEIKIRRMAGPCRNGWERNGGTKWHALVGPSFKAVCGARCRSFWSDEEGREVTCSRCVSKLAELAHAREKEEDELHREEE